MNEGSFVDWDICLHFFLKPSPFLHFYPGGRAHAHQAGSSLEPYWEGTILPWLTAKPLCESNLTCNVALNVLMLSTSEKVSSAQKSMAERRAIAD